MPRSSTSCRVRACTHHYLSRLVRASTHPSCLVIAILAFAASNAAADDALPLVLQEDFEQGADRWKPTDEKAWKLVDHDGGKAYSLFAGSKYSPPHRSPVNFSLLNDVAVSDFVLEAKMLSTGRDYGHRDLCLFFGYQNPAHFYYVHLAKNADDHANQIFIVNGKPREKISITTSKGTNWNDDWHHVKVVRNTADGTIEVFFDDMTQPVMTAKDKTFSWGQVGIGSFDDTGNFDDVVLHGRTAEAAR